MGRICSAVGVFLFFFSSRRRHTRSLCDWSSDVCSSDLLDAHEPTSRPLEADVPIDAAVTGIDGLVWAGGGLVGIQNGILPHRVTRFRLDAADWKSGV